MKSKNFISILFLLLLSLLIATSAMGDATVAGTANPAIDIPAVQAAVNSGGVVMLQGTFDFGLSGVNILNSVQIIGNNAIIINGIVPFYIHSPGSDIKIDSLTLVNPMFIGIYSLSCGSLTINNVDINGVRTYSYARWGTLVNGYEQVPRTMIDNVSITNCNIDLVGSDEFGSPICPYANDGSDNYTVARGIVVGWGIGTPENEVNIHINANVVRNTTQRTILVTDIAGTAIIENNISEPGNFAIIYPSNDFSGNNIAVGQHEPYGRGDPTTWAKYIVKKNTLTCVPKTYPDGSPFQGYSWGIFVFGNSGALIQKNKITSTATDIYLMLFDFVSDAYVGQNKLIGSSLEAGMVIDYSSNNIFVGNNLALIDSLSYLLGEYTENNIVEGPTGVSESVIDLGFDNFLTGVTPMADAGGIGLQISQAIHELHDQMSNGSTGPQNLP